MNGHGLPMSLHHIRLSSLFLAIRVFSVLFIAESVYGILLIYFLLAGLSSEFQSLMLLFLWIVQIAIFVLELVLITLVILLWATTIYYLSDHHLVRFRGILRVDEDIYELQSLRSVKLHENWVGKLFNFGDLQLTFGASGYHEDLWLKGIVEPKKYERILRGFLEVESRLFTEKKGPTG